MKKYDPSVAFAQHLSELVSDHERTDTIRTLASAYFVTKLIETKQSAAVVKAESRMVAETLDGLTRSPYLHAETFGYHPMHNGQVAHVKPITAFGRDSADAKP